MEKCTLPPNVTLAIDGQEIDPCKYVEIQKIANVTVTISKCINCGHIDISWERQDDSYDIPLD